MISSVTTTTVTTVTTTTTATSAVVMSGVTAALALIPIIALVVLLATKEIASSGEHRFRLGANFLNVGIIPLLLVFAMVFYNRVLDALR